MSDRTLSVVNEGINVTGVAMTRNGVLFTKDLSLDQVGELLEKVAELGAGVSWWIGDIGLELQAKASRDEKVIGQEQVRAGEAEEDIINRRLRVSEQYAITTAEAFGISTGHFHDCVMLARFYKISDRSENLSWSHHEVAMRGAGGAKADVKRAKAWLRDAMENKWSVSELRRQVNMRLASSEPSVAPAEENPFDVVDQVDAWLSKRPALPRITADEARAQLVRWDALVKFVHGLEQIASEK